MWRRGLSNRFRFCFLLIGLTWWGNTASNAQSSGAGESFEARATAFLEAATILDLEIEQRELEPCLLSLLDEAWSEDRDLIAPILLQAEALIRFEQREGGGWFRSMWNGWSVLAEIVDRYNKSLKGLQGTAVYTRLYREDLEGLFPNGGGFLYQNNHAIFRVFQAHGGNYNFEKGMDHLSRELRDACGEGSMFPLLLTFAHFPSYLRPAQQRDLRRWVKEIETGTRKGDREVARWVGLGCRINLLEERSLSGPDGLEPEEVDQLEEQLLRLLEDERISPAWRHGLAARLSTTMPERIGHRLRISIGRLSGEVFQKDIPFSSIGMARCLWAFLEIEEETDEWKDVATLLEKGWRHRNRLNGQSKGVGMALDPSRLTVLGMMEVACRLKDRNSIDWHLDSFAETHGAFPGMLVSMVSAGYHDLAEEILRKRGDKVRYRRDHYLIGPRFSGRLHEQTQAFLNGIKSTDWRNYARLLLAATPDPNPEFCLDDRLPRRHERLEIAAEPLRSRSISNEVLRLFGNDILSSIRGGESLDDVLNKPAAHFFEKLQAGESMSPTELYWLTHQHFYGAMVQLSEGEGFPAQFTWGRIIFEDHENSREMKRHGAEAIVDMLHLWLRELVLQEEKETLQALLPFGRQVVETVPTQVYRDDVSRLQNILLIAHVYSEEMKAYEAWWNTLRMERQDFLSELLYDEMGLIDLTGQLLNPRKEYAGDRFPVSKHRAQQYLSLISSSLVNRGYARAQLFGYGFSRELIIEEDLETIARQSAVLAPRSGSAVREWLGWMSDESDLEEVLAEIQRVLSEPEWGHLSEVERFAVRLEKVLVLALIGREDSARALVNQLEAIDAELPTELNSYFAEVKKQFPMIE